MKADQNLSPATPIFAVIFSIAVFFGLSTLINRSNLSSKAPSAAFMAFQRANTGGVVRQWKMGSDSNYVHGDVSPAWKALSQPRQFQELKRLWGAWVALNSPKDPRKSSLALFEGPQDVGSVGWVGVDDGRKWVVAIRRNGQIVVE